jgi:hypothetical protein
MITPVPSARVLSVVKFPAAQADRVAVEQQLVAAFRVLPAHLQAVCSTS